MDTLLRRRMMMLESGGGGGGGFQKIEYLGATGTQAIDTGIAMCVPGSMRVVVDWERGSSGYSDRYLFGSAAVATGGFNLIHTSSIAIGIWLNDFYVKRNLSCGGGRHTIDISVPEGNVAGTVVLDGSSASLDKRAHNVTGLNLVIFSARDANGDILTSTCINAKLYAFQIYINGVKVRDFTPYRYGQTGYLYDSVSDQYFGNALSGDFVLGPDV